MMESSPFLRSLGRLIELLSCLAFGALGTVFFIVSLIRAKDPDDNELNGATFFLIGLGLLLLTVFGLDNFISRSEPYDSAREDETASSSRAAHRNRGFFVKKFSESIKPAAQ